jgi:hypothetical protein
MAGGAAVLLALLIGAFGAGRATAPAPVRAASPVPISLPTVLPVVEHDGEMARIAWGAHASDPRTIAVRLPAMRHGWSLATACLARDPHPRVLPTQTVLLFDDLDLQLISRTVRCDAVERDFIAIVGPAAPASVRMVLVLDPLTVRSGWVSLVPTQR